MIAGNLISDSVPSVKTSDEAGMILNWMNEFKVGQLPIVNHEAYLGLITEDDLLEIREDEAPIGSIDLRLPRDIYVNENSHVYDVIAEMRKYQLDIVPVINGDEAYQGLITKTDVLNYMSESLGALDPGGIIVLEVNYNSYSLSEIGRITESCDAKVLSLTVQSAPNNNTLFITLKLNIRDISRLVATFERFNYNIFLVILDQEEMQDYVENFEALMRYLHI